MDGRKEAQNAQNYLLSFIYIQFLRLLSLFAAIKNLTNLTRDTLGQGACGTPQVDITST